MLEQWKLHFREQHGCVAALRSPPHLTLRMPFYWRDKKTKHLEDALDKIAQVQAPFDVHLNGFGAFPPRVIFARVEDNAELMAFQAAVVRMNRTELNLDAADYKNRPFHPHMTVAFRDLKKRDFLMAWNHMRTQVLQLSFAATSLCLLRHDGKKWRIRDRFYFGRTGH